MTKWYNKVASKVGDTADNVKDGAKDLLGSGSDLVKNGKCYKVVTALQSTGKECYTLAKETSELCKTTQSRGQDMIDFGSDITSTLKGFSTKMDVETLETIKDLIDGDRLEASMNLAQDMDKIALSCVDKSCQMIGIMEKTLDAVPKPIQHVMDKTAGKADAKSTFEQNQTRDLLSTLDQDLEDGKACVAALQHLDIATALRIGTQAFENLSVKAKMSKSMFTTIQGFSDKVSSYTKAINDGDIGDMFKLAAKVKDVWHCLKLSGFMRQLAEAAAQVIRVMIDLFKAMSDRLSVLWSALAFAKDCMVDCIEHVLQAKNLILNAQEKSALLIQHSRSISTQLNDLGALNMNSMKAISKLSKGGEINQAIDIACSMDDIVLDCSTKVVSMVERVTEGVQNLPPIIVGDINVQEEGKHNDDREPDDIEESIANLERSAKAIDNSDIITATRASVVGFRGALDTEDTCHKMLSLIHGFAGDCNSVIDSFLGVWDLESAMIKISEMCRIVRLGDLIKQYADQIKRLLKAIVAVMKATLEKLSTQNLSKLGAGDAADAVQGGLDEIKDKVPLLGTCMQLACLACTD